MNEQTIAFLKKAYKGHYYNADSIEFPAQIQSREFGYIPFGGGMVRHLSFRSGGEAVAEILRQSPSSVYCSNARHASPALPLDAKGWMGAELIFDIDATDISTGCKKTHDMWYCEACHSTGRLPRPRKCPKCDGRTEELHGTCKVCLAAAKEHVYRVMDFLANDFGVSAPAVRTYFSGSRGYHLHVFDERFDLLDQQGRAEIADYMLGLSLPANQSIASALRRRPTPLASGAGGWMKRITRYAEARPNHPGTMQKLVGEAIASQVAMIDASVTTDIHRVFRLAGTLHGTTGMSKAKVGSLDSFNPEVEPVVISGETVRVDVKFYPRFSIMGNEYGPFKSTVAELPSYAAIPILTRGFGEVA